MKHGFGAAAGALALSALWGCGGAGPSTPSDGPSIAISVAPLDYAAPDSAAYTIEVFTRDDDGVMQPVVARVNYRATGPHGALTYIAPCVAGDGGSRLGQVRITITDFFDDAGHPLTDVALPPPQTKQFLCSEQQDTLVEFEFTVIRSLNNGFADIVVDIDDIYCAAKIDCQPDLYPDPETGSMGPALVFGLACTGGDNVALGDNLLAFSFDTDPAVACPGLTGDPVTYTGYQTTDNLGFWNTILPLTRADTGVPCDLHATGLLYDRASPGRPAQFQTGGATIDFHISLSGAGTCDAASPPDVQARYAQLAGVHAFAGEAPATKEAPVSFQTVEVRAATADGVAGHEVRTLRTHFPGAELEVSQAWSFVVDDGSTSVGTEFMTACTLPGDAHTAAALFVVVNEQGDNTPLGAVRLDYDASTGAWSCDGGDLPDAGRYCLLTPSDVPCFLAPGGSSGPNGTGAP